MAIVLDQYQQEVLDYDGNIALRSGRQVGKSTVISIKAAEYAVKHEKVTIMIVAAVERQAYLLFEKVVNYMYNNYAWRILQGINKPTQTRMRLNNGSQIYCLPCGVKGEGVRGFTINMLIADEAAYIPDEVFTALTPELVTTKGQIILLSTPKGREGYFHSCFTNPLFKTFHIKSEDCPRVDKEFLKQERERMTKLSYAQEYEGEFLDELRQFFPTQLIKDCMTLQQSSPSFISAGDLFLGVDIARMGEDETVFCSVSRINREKVRMIDYKVTTKTLLTETISEIKILDRKYNYRKIYIDDAGLGAGVFDVLMQDEQTKRKVIGINNAQRSIERGDKRHKTLMKEDLYMNLLKLMESRAIVLFEEPEILLSLKSMQYEYENGELRIFGNYSHIAEALVRAAFCMKEKSLNLWVK